MEADLGEVSLCTACRKVDFPYMLAYVQSLNNSQHGSQPLQKPVFHLVHSDSCPLCAILTPYGQPGEEFEMFPDNVSHNDYANFSQKADTLPIVQLYVEQQEWTRNITFYIPMDYGAPVNALSHPHPVSPTPDYAAARVWIEHCQKHHGIACNQTSVVCIEGMRLIDVSESRVVKVAGMANPRWVALSYVWGNTNPQYPSITPSKTGHLPKELPNTIQDAITVTQILGYRYLWVDELCIAQGDSVHRASQIQQMDRIYQEADLTIVAACGADKRYGLPGVGTTLRFGGPLLLSKLGAVFNVGPNLFNSVRDSAWWTRAWTYQEGYLSKRLLIFSDFQMSFMCRKACHMEALEVLVGVRSPVWLDERNMEQWDLMWTSDVAYMRPRTLESIISSYSTRSLTRSDDVLNAVWGTLQAKTREPDPVYNLAGLPYYRSLPDADAPLSIEEAVSHALSWHVNSLHSQRRPGFPSWTWTGWTKKVMWYPLLAGKGCSLLCNVMLEDKSGEPVVLRSATSGSTLQYELNKVATLSFKAPCIPASLFQQHSRELRIDGHEADFEIPTEGDVTTNPLLMVREGLWSCLVLRKYLTPVTRGNDESCYNYGILVCRWVSGDTAERVGSCHLRIDDQDEQGVISFEERLEAPRSVRLISNEAVIASCTPV